MHAGLFSEAELSVRVDLVIPKKSAFFRLLKMGFQDHSRSSFSGESVATTSGVAFYRVIHQSLTTLENADNYPP